MAAFPLFDLGVIIVAATLAAYLAKIFHQPKLLAYIIAGVAIGPFGLNLLQDTEVIWGFAELGIAFLLFIVGLELDVSKLKAIGFDSLLIGLGQMTACFIAGYFLASALGFTDQTAMFLSMVFVFRARWSSSRVFRTPADCKR